MCGALQGVNAVFPEHFPSLSVWLVSSTPSEISHRCRQHLIHNISILIKASNDPVCCAWKRLHSLCFSALCSGFAFNLPPVCMPLHTVVWFNYAEKSPVESKTYTVGHPSGDRCRCTNNWNIFRRDLSSRIGLFILW